jgi:hypothetical protein
MWQQYHSRTSPQISHVRIHLSLFYTHIAFCSTIREHITVRCFRCICPLHYSAYTHGRGFCLIHLSTPSGKEHVILWMSFKNKECNTRSGEGEKWSLFLSLKPYQLSKPSYILYSYGKFFTDKRHRMNEEPRRPSKEKSLRSWFFNILFSPLVTTCFGIWNKE